MTSLMNVCPPDDEDPMSDITSPTLSDASSDSGLSLSPAQLTDNCLNIDFAYDFNSGVINN